MNTKRHAFVWKVMLGFYLWLAYLGASFAQSYVVNDLGTLGGNSTATGINNQGQVVGYYVHVSSGFIHPFLYSKGKMVDLNSLLPTNSTWLLDMTVVINNSGQIAGNGATGSGAFLYSGGTFTDLGSLGGGASVVGGMNNQGQIVGYSMASVYNIYPFVYSNGVMTSLGTLGGNSGSADGINDLGQIVGYSTLGDNTSRAFLYSGGVMTNLGTLPGGGNSSAGLINNNGLILGGATMGKYQPNHLFLMTTKGGDMQDLTARWNLQNCGVSGINNLNQIVGTADFPTGAGHAFFCDIDHGFMPIDLNLRIPANSGWVLNTAMSINELGQIVGSGTNPSGQSRAFLLTPVSLVPTLTIACSAGQVTLCWPTNCPGFIPEWTSNLNSNNPWTPVMPEPCLVNGKNCVTNPIGDSPLFYRLRQ